MLNELDEGLVKEFKVIEVPKGFVALDETLQNAFFKLTKHLLV
jgi:hypothetical protein